MQILAFIFYVNEVVFHFSQLYPVLNPWLQNVVIRLLKLLEKKTKQKINTGASRVVDLMGCDNALYMQVVMLNKHGLTVNHLRFSGRNVQVTFIEISF